MYSRPYLSIFQVAYLSFKPSVSLIYTFITNLILFSLYVTKLFLGVDIHPFHHSMLDSVDTRTKSLIYAFIAFTVPSWRDATDALLG